MVALVTSARLDRAPETASEERLWELRDRWDRTINEREWISRLGSFAKGRQTADLPTLTDEPLEHLHDKPLFSPNLLGNAVTQLSYLYNDQPSRRMAKAEEAEWAKRALWNFGPGLDAVLDQADWYTRLTGTELAYLAYRPSEKPLGLREVLEGSVSSLDADGIMVRHLTPDRWVVLEHPDDPTEIEAVLLLFGYTLRKNELVERFYFFDESHWAMLERRCASMSNDRRAGQLYRSWAKWTHLSIPAGDKQLDFMPHPYGAVPVVPLRNELAQSEFFVPGLGGDDALQNARSIARYITEILWTAFLQRGQPWTNGEIKEPAFSPVHLLQVAGGPAGGASFAIEEHGADLEGMINVLTTMLDVYASALGLPSFAFHPNEAQYQNSLSILDGRLSLKDDRRRRTRLWSYQERQIHRLAAGIYNAHRGTSYTGEVAVEFHESPHVLSVEQLLELAKTQSELGTITRRALIKAFHPEFDDEQIEARIAEVDEEREGETRRRALVAGHAGDAEEGGEDDHETEDAGSGVDKMSNGSDNMSRTS